MIEDYGQINDRSPHLIADLCEIIAYFESREVSRGDIEMFLDQKGGEGLLSDLDISGLDSASVNEKLQALSEDVFNHLNYRVIAFGDWYPFQVEGDLLIPLDDVTDRHKTYAALTAYSRLKMFKSEERTDFAAKFEVLCKVAAKGFADGWNVIHFGTGGGDRAKFGNKKKEALRNLCEEIREIPILQEIDDISEQDTGDAGIDLVLIKPWTDPARGVAVYFAQCAARKDQWPQKRFEAHSLNLGRYFSFFHTPGTMLCIPVFYRGVDGNWINSDGHNAIVVDRLRLVQLLSAEIDKSGEPAVFGEIARPFELGCAVAGQAN